MASSSLSFHWEKMKLLAIFSFGIKKQDFIKIKLSSNKQGREENVSAINKDHIPQSCKSSLCKRSIWKCITHSYHVDSCISAKWDSHIEIWRFWRQRWTKIWFVLCKQEEPKEEVHYLYKNFKPKLWTLKILK